MNKVKHFILLVAVLFNSIFLTGFHSMPMQEECSIVDLFFTFIGRSQPCGFDREQMLSFVFVYFDDIVEDVKYIPKTTSTSLHRREYIPTLRPISTPRPTATFVPVVPTRVREEEEEEPVLPTLAPEPEVTEPSYP